MKMFEELVGKTFNFYGVNCNCFKLNSKVWEATEDGDDGYRSYLDSIETSTDDLVFPRRMLARVKLVEGTDDDGFVGWQLVDEKDGHIWLEVGTDQYDTYYPCFVFDYRPKEK